MSDDTYDVYETLRRALFWRNEFALRGLPHLLLYSALDTRFCIEQTLYEHLDFLHAEELSKQLRKLYSAKDLRAAIFQIEPNFERKLSFIKIFLLPFTPGYEPAMMATPDLDLLVEVYGQIGNYLHVQRPQRDLAALDEVLRRANAHLEQILMSARGALHLTERGQELFDRYLRGEISDDEVRSELAAVLAATPMRRIEPPNRR